MSSAFFVFEGALSTRLLFTGVQSYVEYRTVYVWTLTYDTACGVCTIEHADNQLDMYCTRISGHKVGVKRLA